jgi:xylan 1,4-beta-xylosidase
MRGDRVKVGGGSADVDALAARADRTAAVLVWNYHEDDVPGDDVPVRLAIAGLPNGRALVQHYRIDQRHSNAYARWKAMGSPQSPSAEQYRELEAAGQLELLESPRWIEIREGKAEIGCVLPRQGVSLVRLEW